MSQEDSQSKLTADQRQRAKVILDRVRQEIADAANGDASVAFAIRRYVYVRLSHDERSRPMDRRKLKVKKSISSGASVASAVNHSNRYRIRTYTERSK